MARVNHILTLLILLVLKQNADLCVNLNLFQNRPIETMERIQEAGLPTEKHKIKTTDGYILTVFRIPSHQNVSVVESVFSKFMKNIKHKMHKLPVLLLHGIHCSSDVYVVDNTGLGIQLGKAGYDVWLGNFRGTSYSRGHVSLSPDEKDYWNFSYHEMGLFDATAFIDHILHETNNKQLHLIGHSMGTTVSYVMASLRPSYNRKVRTLISLAPVARMTKYYSISYNNSLVYNFLNGVLDDVENQGRVEVFPRNHLKGRSSHQVECTDFFITVAAFCCSMIQLAQMLTRGPVVPGGTSMKTTRHYMQNIGTGKFQPFDYQNDERNTEKWGRETPDEYDLTKVTSPTAIFFTPTDELVAVKDVEYLLQTLPNVIKVWKAPPIGFSHIDFIVTSSPFSIASRRNMTNEIIKLLHERNYITSVDDV